MPNLTWYMHHFDNVNAPGWDGTTIESLCGVIRTLTPRGWKPALLVKAHSGSHWQADFDRHTLAITGPDQLASVRDAFQAGGVAFGVWGEPRGPLPAGGDLAGIAAGVAGYYAVDVEPYSDFGLDRDMSPPTPVEYAEGFWDAFLANGGTKECGVSIVPLPSGVDLTSEGTWYDRETLRAWLRRVKYVEPQCYVEMNADLHPRTALPFFRQKMREGALRPKRIAPIFSRADDWQTRLTERVWRWGASIFKL